MAWSDVAEFVIGDRHLKYERDHVYAHINYKVAFINAARAEKTIFVWFI